MSTDRGGFMDGKTWLAIALVMVFWFGWQSYLAKKYGKETPATATSPAAGVTSLTPPSPTAEAKPAVSPIKTVAEMGASIAPEAMFEYSDETLTLKISSRGMSVREATLLKFKDREGQPMAFGRGVPTGVFKTELLGVAPEINFDITRSANTFRGIALLGNVRIEKTTSVESARYLLKVETRVTGLDGSVRGLRTSMAEVAMPVSSSIFAPSTDIQSLYIAHGTTSTRETLSHEGSGKISDDHQNVSVVAVGPLYFTRAILDDSDLHPQYTGAYSTQDGDAKTVIATANLDYIFPLGLGQTTLKYDTFIGPKELSLFTSISPKMEGILDYWVVGALAKPMLNLMKKLHEFIPNWGWAIILLTIIIRALVLPLYLSSFKSMKAMQKIQPQMQSLRERYKENPQQLNTEVMKLFRENKVNPVGGCLPMLLQLPIFIALYRVLSQSIELYQAPFGFWIQDLSIKDPYYVLPVLMGISMFIQQKITPMTTTDPAQRKVMLFMPVIFSFMMFSLPSGLTLYIFVSTLFGIIQQMIFMKDKTPKTVTARA